MTFGKVMGGGFPAAAFGGRAELMQHLAPVGGVYQAGTLSGNPVATAAGLATLRLADRRGLRPRSTGSPPSCRPRCPRRSDRGGCAARHPGRRELVQRVLRHRGRDRRAGLRHRGARRTPAPTPPSSTRCSTPASTCRRARTRAGSSPTAHDDRALDRIVARCRPRPRAAAAAAGPRGERPADESGIRLSVLDALRHEQPTRRRASGPARRGLQPGRAALRAAARLPPVRAGPGDGRPGRRGPAGPRHRAPALLAAGAGPGDDGPAGRGARAAGDHRRPGDRGRELPRGTQGLLARAPCATPGRGGCSATRSSRPGASPTARSSPGCGWP